MSKASPPVQGRFRAARLEWSVVSQAPVIKFCKEDAMKLTRLQAGVPTLTRDMDEVFDRIFNAPVPFPAFGYEPLKKAMEGTWMPALDLTEKEKEFVIRAEIPGVPRENLDVHLEGDVLTLTGHREKMTREATEHVLWEERETGFCPRCGIDEEGNYRKAPTPPPRSPRARISTRSSAWSATARSTR